MADFITSPQLLRERILAITKRSAGKRFVAAAFVGRDALSFIPEPSGIEFYCWDNPIATHPEGVADLISTGADVYFVTGLHTKVYWSESAGVLIGSSNVSASALQDDTTQLEAGVFFKDSKAISIDALRLEIKRLKPRKVDGAALDAFRKKCINRLGDQRPRIY